MKKLVILSGLIAVIGLSAPASLTFAASRSKSPTVSAPPKVMTKPPAGKTVAKPPGKGGITPRPGKGGVAEQKKQTRKQKLNNCLAGSDAEWKTCDDGNQRQIALGANATLPVLHCDIYNDSCVKGCRKSFG